MNPRMNHTSRGLRRGALLAAVAVSVGSLAGCGDGAGTEGAPVPDGWTRVDEGRLSVAVPEEWVEVAGGGDGWTTGRADAPLDSATVLLVLNPDMGAVGAVMGVSTFVAGAQIGGTPMYSSTSRSAPVDTDVVTVERNDYTYQDGAGVTYQGIFWAASDPDDDRTAALQLTGASLPDDLVEQIQRSIRIIDEPVS